MARPAIGEQRIEGGEVVVGVGHHRRAREPRARKQAGMGKRVDRHQVVAADQRRNDAGIGEIARSEHAGGFGALEARQPRFELLVERMVAGDEARGPGADAIPVGRLAGRRGERRMSRQAEVIVA